LGDLNTLLAAAREALPLRARDWDDLSLSLLTVTQGSQTFTGRQALALLTAQTLTTLDSAQRSGASLSEAPVFGLDDAVFTNPLISGQKISLRQLVERMRENTGYDPLAHLQPLPQQWRINDVNALIDGINQALQPTTTVSLVSFNFVNADGLALTAQQAYAYSLLKALDSAGSSSALASVWSTYTSAANGTSSTYNGSTVNLSDLQAFNTAAVPLGWTREPDGSQRFCIDHYLHERPVETAWRGIRITNWHRPLSTYMAGLLGEGFVLEHFAEPVPQGVDDDKADRYRRAPNFLVMRWRKAG
jgi:hypothetical protein